MVGVGGIGCWIADRVYEMATESGTADSSRIVILGFDTDDNDLAKLKHLKSNQLIRTSTADTVYTVLARNGEAIEPWFVDDDELTAAIRQMTLLDGAGAIRMLSRLAFHEALRDPGISQQLYTAVGSIATQNNRDIFPGRVNVLMVGSIAGGTGSGMFLQSALVLGDILRQRGITPVVRGLFLMPDIVVNAARIRREQIEQVRANAYAALKELNAVSRHTQGIEADGVRQRQVEFAYAEGGGLKPDGRPFTSVVLMDYEQTRGTHLGHNFEAYRELAAQAAYTLLFTPIGGRYASRLVNDVRDKHSEAAQGNDNLFAGIGVSSVVYPQARILDYLCVEYGLQALASDWLRLDHEFKEELARFNARVNLGEANLEKPNLGRFYAQKLEQLANAEQIRFFREIHSKVCVRTEDDLGRESVDERFRTYLDALERHLLAAFWSSNEALRTTRKREEIGADALTEKESLANDVGAFERNLRKGFEAVESGLAATVENLFHTSVLGAAVLAEPEWKDYHLETYVLRGGPHLVQVRYFLYKLRAEIAERSGKLADRRPREAIVKALGRDFDPRTPDSTESANQVAAELVSRGIPDIVDRRFARFVRDYRDHYNLVCRKTRDLGDEGVRARLYDLLDRYLVQLLAVVERFFADLEDLAEDLALERNQMLEEHGVGSGLGVSSRFVYADAAAKAAMWQHLRDRLSGSGSEEQKVNVALTQSLVERFRGERRRDGAHLLAPFSGADLFRRDVLEGFARPEIVQNHGGAYRMTALDAVRKEAYLQGRDPDDHLRTLVDLVSAQSEPFLVLNRADAAQSYRFWALSPANAEVVGRQEQVSALFRRNDGEEPVIEPEFPDHTLLCVSTVVDLCLSDLGKLDPGLSGHTNVAARQPGIYYRAYRDMVDRALAHERESPGTPNPVFTPHLDRYWHRPGVLPEIHQELEDRQNRDLMDAYVCGLALDLMPWATRDGQAVTLFRDASRLGTFDYERVLAEIQDDIALLEVLGREPAMVGAILERRGKVSAADSSDDPLHRGLTDPATLARIVRMMGDRTRAEIARPLTQGAVESLFAHLAQTSERLHRRLGPNARKDRLREISEQLIDAVVAELAAELDAEILAEVQNVARGQLSRQLER